MVITPKSTRTRSNSGEAIYAVLPIIRYYREEFR